MNAKKPYGIESWSPPTGVIPPADSGTAMKPNYVGYRGRKKVCQPFGSNFRAAWDELVAKLVTKDTLGQIELVLHS